MLRIVSWRKRYWIVWALIMRWFQMPICTHKRYDWLATAVSKSPENKAKISASGQTCGQMRKTGLFNPQNREEQAHWLYCENARFQEIKRENKRKSEVRLNLRFWSEWQDLNLRPLPPQRPRAKGIFGDIVDYLTLSLAIRVFCWLSRDIVVLQKCTSGA